MNLVRNHVYLNQDFSVKSGKKNPDANIFWSGYWQDFWWNGSERSEKNEIQIMPRMWLEKDFKIWTDLCIFYCELGISLFLKAG